MLSNIVDVGIAKKQNYITPGGRCSRRGLKTAENLKTLMLKMAAVAHGGSHLQEFPTIRL